MCSEVIIEHCSMRHFFIIVTADSKPSIKMLQRHVIPYMATKWYELGAELLDEKEEHTLSTIEINYSRDANKCCFEMFRRWLQTDVNATWSRIVEALESPGINLASLATDLRELIGKIAVFVHN